MCVVWYLCVFRVSSCTDCSIWPWRLCESVLKSTASERLRGWVGCDTQVSFSYISEASLEKNFWGSTVDESWEKTCVICLQISNSDPLQPIDHEARECRRVFVDSVSEWDEWQFGGSARSGSEFAAVLISGVSYNEFLG